MILDLEIKDTIINKLYDTFYIKSYNELIEIIEDSLIKYTNMYINELNNVIIDKPTYTHYVYVWLNPLKKKCYYYNSEVKFEYEPFYVGKGYLNRDIEEKDNSDFMYYINLFKSKNISPIVIRFKENLHPLEAYKVENYLINLIGTIMYNNGPLTNKTKLNKSEVLDNYILPNSINIEDNKIHSILKELNNQKNIKEAAKILKVSERSLYRYITAYHIIYDKIDKKYIQK